ncbi:MAG: hypothetical protein M1828_000470 [Chrysothrix sp. TS-e1954]|nr:MAG: hypothetical protein M1828_000470 [Chrysothrix sp. TS-e1954]
MSSSEAPVDSDVAQGAATALQVTRRVESLPAELRQKILLFVLHKPRDQKWESREDLSPKNPRSMACTLSGVCTLFALDMPTVVEQFMTEMQFYETLAWTRYNIHRELAGEQTEELNRFPNNSIGWDPVYWSDEVWDVYKRMMDSMRANRRRAGTSQFEANLLQQQKFAFQRRLHWARGIASLVQRRLTMELMNYDEGA